MSIQGNKYINRSYTIIIQHKNRFSIHIHMILKLSLIFLIVYLVLLVLFLFIVFSDVKLGTSVRSKLFSNFLFQCFFFPPRGALSEGQRSCPATDTSTGQSVTCSRTGLANGSVLWACLSTARCVLWSLLNDCSKKIQCRSAPSCLHCSSACVCVCARRAGATVTAALRAMEEGPHQLSTLF